MQVEQGEGHLHEPIQDLLFGEVFPLRTLDPRVHVTPIAVGHDDIEVTFPVDEGVLVCHNIGVPDLL